MNKALGKPGRWDYLPISMRGFVLAYLLCTVFGAANSALQFDFLKIRLDEMLQQPDPPRDWMVYAFVAFRALVALTMLGWALARQSVIARLLIGLQLIGWLYGTPTSIQLVLDGNWRALPFLLAALASIFVVAFMLQEQSRQWFRRKGKTLRSDVETFE